MSKNRKSVCHPDSPAEVSAPLTADNVGQILNQVVLAEPAPSELQPLPSEDQEELPVRPFTVRFLDNGPSRIKLLRYLLGCLFYSKGSEGLSFEQTVALFELRLEFHQKMDKDKGFRMSFEDSFLRLNQLLTFFSRVETFPVVIDRLPEELLKFNLGHLYLDERGFNGCRGQKCFRKAFVLSVRNSVPPKAFDLRWMGVGQRETSGRNDVGFDGSPHWTEVFKVITPLEHLEDEPSTGLTEQ